MLKPVVQPARTDPNPSDDAARQAELAEELKFLEGDELPEFVKDADKEDADEKTKKTARAFVAMRDTVRTAKGLIEEYRKELESTKGKKSEPNPAATGDGSVQVAGYLDNLKTRAMSNLGIRDINNPLVIFEMERLYSDDWSASIRSQEAEKTAGATIEQTLAAFPVLDNVDKVAIRAALALRPAVEQASPSIIKSEVHRHMGENFEKFRNKAPSSSGGAGAAAASQAKSQGSGVSLNLTPGSSEQEKPASVEELKKMKALGIPADHVGLFRRAQEKRALRS